jgi:hypothetical protein
VSRDPLEAAVLDQVRRLAREVDPEEIAEEVRRHLPRAPRVDVSELERKRARLARRRDELLVDLDRDEDFVRDGVRRLEEEDRRLAREIERAQVENLDVDDMVAAAVEAAQRLEAPNTEEGRLALQKVLGAFVADLKVGPADRRQPKPVRLEVYTPTAMALNAFPERGGTTWRLTHPRA